ncbi:hypothetical protein X781_23720 [Mannheimia sp. USDA-ARS-USMARC-1261]|nr:hypothetical protein X781_23720 [Mannheimia sp. USDA-ARS-USMARC-1261]
MLKILKSSLVLLVLVFLLCSLKRGIKFLSSKLFSQPVKPISPKITNRVNRSFIISPLVYLIQHNFHNLSDCHHRRPSRNSIWLCLDFELPYCHIHSRSQELPVQRIFLTNRQIVCCLAQRLFLIHTLRLDYIVRLRVPVQRFCIPVSGLFIALGNTSSVFIHCTEIVLCILVSLFSSFCEPVNSLLIIFGHAFPI